MKIQINKTYQQLFGSDGTLRKDVRYFEIYGGRRSGKSHEIAQTLCLTAMMEPDHFIPCIRKIGTTLKDSVYAEIRAFLRTHNIVHQENKTDKEFELPNGSRLRCFGLDDPDKMKSIVGPTIFWIDEATELDEADFDSLDAGLSPANHVGRIILSHNPVPRIVGVQHWIEKRFLNIPHELSKAVINEEANALVLRTWYRDNAFCPPATIAVLEGYKKTNPEKYKLWALGEFTTVEGAVFTNWDIVSDVPTEGGIKHLGYGMDFGFAEDPATLINVWGRGMGTPRAEIWLREDIYETGLTNQQLGSRMRGIGVERYDEIIADSAEPKSIEEIRLMGFNIHPAVKGPDSIRNGILQMQAMSIHIVAGSSNLIKEFSTYCWKRDKNSKVLPVPIDDWNHGIDAVRYRVTMPKKVVSRIRVLGV